MLPVIIPTFMSKTESVLDDKGFTISWHAYAYSHQMTHSNSEEGLPERLNPLLRAATTNNHRRRLDYILETWTPAYAHLNFLSIMPVLPFDFSYLLFACLLFR